MKLEEIHTTYRIFAATNGNLSATVNLISDVYMLSRMEKKPINLNLFSDVLSSYGVDDRENSFLLSLDQLELHELIIHSDWRFGYRANKNSIISAEYATYGISTGGKVYCMDGVA